MSLPQTYVYSLVLSAVHDPLEQCNALWSRGRGDREIMDAATHTKNFRLQQALEEWRAESWGPGRGFFGQKRRVQYCFTDILLWIPQSHWDRYSNLDRHVLADNLTKLYHGHIAVEERLNQREPAVIVMPMKENWLLDDQVLFQFGHGIHIPRSDAGVRVEEGGEDGMFLDEDEIRSPKPRRPSAPKKGTLLFDVAVKVTSKSPPLSPRPWLRYDEAGRVETIPCGIHEGQTHLVLSGNPAQSSIQLERKFPDQAMWFSGNQGFVVLTIDPASGEVSCQGDGDYVKQAELASASEQGMTFCCGDGREYLAIELINPHAPPLAESRRDENNDQSVTGIIQNQVVAGHWLELVGAFLPPIAGHEVLDGMSGRVGILEYNLFLDERGIPLQRLPGGSFEKSPPGAVIELRTTHDGIYWKRMKDTLFQDLNINSEIRDSCNRHVATFKLSPLKSYLGVLRFQASVFKPLNTKFSQILGRRGGAGLLDPSRIVALELHDPAGFHWSLPSSSDSSLGNMELSRDHLELSCSESNQLSIRMFQGERRPKHPFHHFDVNLKLKATVSPGDDATVTLMPGEMFMVGLYLFRYTKRS